MSAPLALRTCTFSRWQKIREIYYIVSGFSSQSKNRPFTNSRKVFNKTPQIKGSAFNTYRDTQRFQYEYASKSVIVQCEYSELAGVLTALEQEFGGVSEAFFYQKTDGLSSVLVQVKNKPNSDRLIINKSSLRPIKRVNKSLLDRVKIYQPQTFMVDELKHCSDVSKQISFLYDNVKMQEVILKQYYVIGTLIKQILHEKYNDVLVGFYGSASCGVATVNNSDLDLAVLLREHYDTKSILRYLHKNISYTKRNSRFFTAVHKIVTARVPIIKFVQPDTGISCDVSCNNLSGMMMAEMLCWLNQYEPMFYPLVITIKLWAKEHRLVRSGVGKHLSNHMLTMLVISFLQHKQFLPALQMAYIDKNVLTTYKNEDLVTTWEELKLKDPTQTVVSKFFVDKTKDLGTLLLEFFQFYSKLPFDECELDILTGKIIKRPHIDYIYMPNPYEYQHNMCHNVGSFYVEKFQFLCEQSAKCLRDSYVKKNDEQPWGIMCILHQETMIKLTKRSLFDLDLVLAPDGHNVEEIVIELDEPKNEPTLYMNSTNDSNNKHTTLNESTKSHTMPGDINGMNIHVDIDSSNEYNEPQTFSRGKYSDQLIAKSEVSIDSTRVKKRKKRKKKKQS
ncbi:hypothetical protein ACF0H5_011870 [Mactra antiquata]